MICISDRLNVMQLINEFLNEGIKLEKICKTIGITQRTYYRWKKKQNNGNIGDLRPDAKRTSPSNKFTQEEVQKILEIMNCPEFASSPPTQVVPSLADQGVYIGSVSTIYRILRQNNQNNHRGRAKKPCNSELQNYCATKPNKVWVWDITYLRGPIKGTFYYLYIISDIFSRFIVGWEVWEEQSDVHASELISRATLSQNVISSNLLVLHTDNGSPMKGSTMLAKLESLGVISSFNRPRVSNDNAFAESLFKTCKYRPNFKDTGFKNLQEAREWSQEFVQWYNNEHHHSGINYLTPLQRHTLDWKEIVQKRTEVFEAAKQAHPERWNNRTVRNWNAPSEVYLHPINTKTNSQKQ